MPEAAAQLEPGCRVDAAFYLQANTFRGTTTLQFRFNPRRGDFELIGKEIVWTSGKDGGRSSVNYLSGKFITSKRVKGRLKASQEKRFVVPALAVLKGFDCGVYEDGTP